MKAKLGIAPIAWWNDDLAELSDDVSLEECLRQAREAGFTGMETGRRFPMDAAVLSPILKQSGMSVCGGWFSGLLLDGDIEAEKDRIAEQMQLFKAVGAPCIVYGETAGTIQGDRFAPALHQAPAHGGRDQGLWPQDDGLCRMVRRRGHADRLSPPYGRADRDRSGARSLDGAFRRGAAAALRRRPHGLCRRRRAAGDRQAPCPHLPCPHQGRPQRSRDDGLDRTRESFLDAVVKGRLHGAGRRLARLRGDRQAAGVLRLRGLVRRRGRAGSR